MSNKEYSRNYYLKNKEQIDEKHRLYKQNNKDKVREQNRIYREKHKKIKLDVVKLSPEQREILRKETAKRYYAEHREILLIKKRLYRKNNPNKQKEYIDKNIEKIRESANRYRSENREKISEWYKTNRDKNKVYQAEYGKKYYQLNKEEIAKKRKITNNIPFIKEKRKKYRYEYEKERLKNDCEFKLKRTLRSRIKFALKSQKILKNKKTEELLGAPIDIARKHIESLFKIGMSWLNHGEWHIDHIRPCVSFDLSDENQQKECFHYTNLQPLWKFDNLSKGSKILEPLQ